MADRLGIGDALVLEHILDKIDATPRAIELVAEDLIGRAGCRAKATVDAGAQDFVGTLDARIGELFGGKGRLHCQPIMPGLRIPRGSNWVRRPAESRARGAGSG